MRYAIRVGYDGSHFNGFSMQPGIRTVEGEIIKRLVDARLIKGRKDAKFQYASRTDRGVHSFGNVIALNSPANPSEIINGIDNIWVTGYAEVEPSFNPRHATWKRYIYYLDERITDKIDFDKLKEAAELFEGEHDFSSFCRNDGRNTRRKIDKINIFEGNIIKIEFIAGSFLWQQIRRMVWSILKVADGSLNKNLIIEALRGNKIQTGAAPPENLVLAEVHYDSISFNKFIPHKIILKREIMNDALHFI